MRNIQHIISKHISQTFWQSFPLHGITRNHEEISTFLTSISSSLSSTGGRSESIWRNLTLRAISSLQHQQSSSTEKTSQMTTTTIAVRQITKTLAPLTLPTHSPDLEKDLQTLITESLSLWLSARQNASNIIISSIPSLDDPKTWHAEDLPISLSDKDDDDDGNLNTPNESSPLCLFPALLQRTSRETVVLMKGSALFPSSRAWVQGIVEKGEHERELNAAMRDAITRVNARRASIGVGV